MLTGVEGLSAEPSHHPAFPGGGEMPLHVDRCLGVDGERGGSGLGNSAR